MENNNPILYPKTYTETIQERINNIIKVPEFNCLPTPFFNSNNKKNEKDGRQEVLDFFKKRKLNEQLNSLKVEGEETKEVKNIEPSKIGDDIIVIPNKEIDNHRKQIYDAIISAFKGNGMSRASIYFALQNIPFIDIVEDVIIIYTKTVELFDKIEIPCINLTNTLKTELKNENIKVKFISYKSDSIAEYFSKKK